jgi:predicted kinase
MAVRAAIRAMVLLQTDQATGQPGANLADARHYLTQAAGHLTPRPPVLIAIGGLSGSGKSVLARDLAAEIGACPGAIHLRTDTERKAPGPAVSYDPAARAAVYDRMLARASVILSAGHGVILDATFLDAAPRAAAAALARRHCAAFHGLWLTAPPDVLIRRVTDRRGDPSDADALVVAAQLARGITPPEEAGWITLDAGRSPLKTRITACALLAAKHKADGAA